MHALLEAIKDNPALKAAADQGRDRDRGADCQAAVRIPQLGPAASAPLEYDLQRGRFRCRLLHSYGGSQVEHPGQLAERNEIFLSGPRRDRARLNGANRYTVTFAKDQTPPVNGFWSLTLYNEHHFFAPNEIKRYSTGTKNKALKHNPDGSLTIYVQADAPPAEQRDNWLPAPKGGDFTLYVRAYWPKARRDRRLMDAAGGAACRLGENGAASLALNGQWKAPLLQVVN